MQELQEMLEALVLHQVLWVLFFLEDLVVMLE
jgi:hypothetical protein